MKGWIEGSHSAVVPWGRGEPSRCGGKKIEEVNGAKLLLACQHTWSKALFVWPEFAKFNATRHLYHTQIDLITSRFLVFTPFQDVSTRSSSRCISRRRSCLWSGHPWSKWYAHYFPTASCAWSSSVNRRVIVLAAQSIANIVKSSLGPLGLDKMLVDNIGVWDCHSDSFDAQTYPKTPQT